MGLPVTSYPSIPEKPSIPVPVTPTEKQAIPPTAHPVADIGAPAPTVTGKADADAAPSSAEPAVAIPEASAADAQPDTAPAG